MSARSARALLVLLLAPACIPPGTINEREQQNGQVELHDALITPPPGALSIQRSQSGTVVFEIEPGTAATDPDGDTIHVYWYVNFQATQAPRPLEASSFALDPCDPFFQGDKIVDLRAVVADRRLDFSQPDFQTFLDPTAVTKAERQWTIFLEGACP